MEFHEKIQELRKSRDLTQEELAAALFVSRAAVSKWESGRGYPSIDSLRDIARFFSVSIDGLLSGEKLLNIAQQENKESIKGICDMLTGITDISTLALIVLPLYPNSLDGFIYSVNLFAYTQGTPLQRSLYWLMYGALLASGLIKTVFIKVMDEKYSKALSSASILLSILTVLILAMAREAYATVVAFALLAVKVLLLFRRIKTTG